MQEDPLGGSVIIQAREVFPWCGFEMSRKRKLKFGTLGRRWRRYRRSILGKECEEFRFGLSLKVPSHHVPAVLDNSDQGHHYSVCHFPTPPRSLKTHELGSVNHTSPQRRFLSSFLCHDKISAPGGALGVGQSVTSAPFVVQLI